MPIAGHGWEILITRTWHQQRGARLRTVGIYQVYRNGIAAPDLTGMTAESPGPGSNMLPGRRIAAGRYPLWTQDGDSHSTLGFAPEPGPTALPRPAIALDGVGTRIDILIHPGLGFLAGTGCINPCPKLPDGTQDMAYADSRARVIALIDDMKAFLGPAFPTRDGFPIPRAWAAIDGEP
jgi:hypothetical protein